jgi:acylphosphatase
VEQLKKQHYALAIKPSTLSSTTNVLYRAPEVPRGLQHAAKVERLLLPLPAARTHAPASAAAVTASFTKDVTVTKDNIDLSLDDDINIAEQLKLMSDRVTNLYNELNSNSVMLSGLVNTVDETNKTAAAAAEYHVTSMTALQTRAAANETRTEAVQLQLAALVGNLNAQSKVVIGVAGDVAENQKLIKALLTKLDNTLASTIASETSANVNALLSTLSGLVGAFNDISSALLDDEDNLSDAVVIVIADAAKQGVVKFLQQFPETNLVLPARQGGQRAPRPQADATKVAQQAATNERRRVNRKKAKEAKAAAAAEHASDLQAAMELDLDNSINSDDSDEAHIVHEVKAAKKRDRVAVYSASGNSGGPPAPPTLMDINMATF